jgi:hypothetical protein
VGPEAIIGNGVKIQDHVSAYKGETLEDDVFCGPSMAFTNVINPRSSICTACGARYQKDDQSIRPITPTISVQVPILDLNPKI